MASVRDIIVEAAARSNVCPRKRVLPDDIFVSGLSLFNGVLEEYSTSEYIDAYQAESDFAPKFESILAGEGEEIIDTDESIGEGEEINDTDVACPKIQLPKRILYKYAGAVDWTPMEFISYSDFYSCAYSDYVCSWQPAAKNLFKLYFKPRFIGTNPECKIVYNVEMQFKDGDTINLPTPYVELITRNLAYKFAIKYPRVDESKKASLLSEKEDLERSLKANNASMHIITRGGTVMGGSYQANLRSGAFISNRYF